MKKKLKNDNKYHIPPRRKPQMDRVKEVMEQRKLRSRHEKKLYNISRAFHKGSGKPAEKPTKTEKKKQQIDQGFEIANKWRKEHAEES